MQKVVTAPLRSYHAGELKALFQGVFTALAFSPRGGKVLLKPNLVMGKAPGKAVNTHPFFVRAIAELLLDHGCTVWVGDSPGYQSTRRALRESGIQAVIRDLDLRVAAFDGAVPVTSPGASPYRGFIFGEDPRAFDHVINLPKLKTHGMMGLTLGVKNTFGFIHGLEKAKWHLKAGRDRLLFASVLIDIHRIVDPALTLLDGIIAMEGDGPTSGKPREIGLVAASANAFCLDHHVEEWLGLAGISPVTLKARDLGLIPPYDLMDGGCPPPEDFRLPATMMGTDWNLPSVVKQTLRRTFTKKPRLQAPLCKGCGACAQVCPAGAITMEHNRPIFTYAPCIRCYCCQEMCPEGAIRV